MDEIDLLPEALRSQSLSEREIVLSYQQALEALEILVAANCALLGWEGWVKYYAKQCGDCSCPGPGKRAVGFATCQEPSTGKKEEETAKGDGIREPQGTVRVTVWKKYLCPNDERE